MKLRHAIESLFDDLHLSFVPVVLFAVWAMQMGTWGWGNSIKDWRSWAGWFGGWLGMRILQAAINRVRTRKAPGPMIRAGRRTRAG